MASIDRPIRLPRVHRRRRHQRGVALVEAAFMLPMFVILWYGSLYVHNLGSKYIAVNTAAREDAWTTAMSNCGVHKSSDSEVLPAAEGSPSPLQNGGGSDTSAVSTALGQGNVDAYRQFVEPELGSDADTLIGMKNTARQAA